MGMTGSSPTVLMGIHHVTLNVQDVVRSERWYGEVLGFERLTGYDTDAFTRVLLRHPDSGVVLGLNRHAADVADEPFDQRRAGLDHLAFHVADRAALDVWMEHFDRHAVTHSPVKPGGVPGSFLVTFWDPDGLQFEVYAPAS